MPVSLSVSSISAQTSFSVGTGGEFGLVEGDYSANITPGIEYTDRPAITFTPYPGQEFLEALSAPIPLEMLVQLEASWSGIDVLLRVAVANLNGIDNRIHRASPEFDRMAAGFRALDTQNDVGTGFINRPVILSEPIPAYSVNADSVLKAARPEQPGIAVEYRDHWYFISDSDHTSKRTFVLMQALFLAQAAEDPGQGTPVLTLPLN